VEREVSFSAALQRFLVRLADVRGNAIALSRKRIKMAF
jgi:hypothetical protein